MTFSDPDKVARTLINAVGVVRTLNLTLVPHGMRSVWKLTAHSAEGGVSDAWYFKDTSDITSLFFTLALSPEFRP